MGPRALRVPTNHYKAEEEVSTRLGLIMIHTHSDRTQAERSQVQPTPPRGVWKRFGLEISFLENLLGGGEALVVFLLIPRESDKDL